MTINAIPTYVPHRVLMMAKSPTVSPSIRFGCGSDTFDDEIKPQECNKRYNWLSAVKKGLLIPLVLASQLFQSTQITLTQPAAAPNQTLLKKHLDALTSIDPSRSFDPNQSNPNGSLDQAANYITQQLTELQIPYQEQHYTGKVKALNPGGKYKNIIVSFGPPNAERLIVGAHYDVCITENPDGRLKPGADDNASGVAGLLELANLLKTHAPKLNKRIDLVFYANEEPPFFRTIDMGSYVHAQSLKAEKAKVAGMIALDMIGYFSDEPNSQGIPEFLLEIPVVGSLLGRLARKLTSNNKENKGNFISVTGDLGSVSFAKRIRNGIQKASSMPAKAVNMPNHLFGLPTMVDFSDHQNYNEDYPAVMLTDTASLRNKNYHTHLDTVDRLNIPKMGEVIKGVYGTLINW